VQPDLRTEREWKLTIAVAVPQMMQIAMPASGKLVAVSVVLQQLPVYLV